MIRLSGSHKNTASFLEDAIDIAQYFGFMPFDRAIDGRRKAQNPARTDLSEIAFARRDERALYSTARSAVSFVHGAHDPLFFWRAASTAPRGERPHVLLELHIVGVPSAIAEAILIRTADDIVAASGINNRILSINSIGTTDSSNRFLRDISQFLRKHIESISPALRPRAATDPLGTLIQLIERGHPSVSRAPQALEYLTEEERRRFWELIEYLEHSGQPYELNPQILGSRDCWSHTLFQIDWLDAETGGRMPVARGGRYDPLSSRFSTNATPAASVSISCEIRGRYSIKKQTPQTSEPSLYFAHLGQEARRKMIPIIELLRENTIRVHHSLMFERIGDQMHAARRLGVPYLLIMGHKEAVDNTVLVREVATNSQRAVPTEELPGYLKRKV